MLGDILGDIIPHDIPFPVWREVFINVRGEFVMDVVVVWAHRNTHSRHIRLPVMPYAM